MVFVDAVLVLAVIGVVVYAAVRAFTRARYQLPAASSSGQWRATHYDAKGATRVVVQKLSPGGANLLDEHLVATVSLDDPDYETKFMTAMATARERRSIFETEAD